MPYDVAGLLCHSVFRKNLFPMAQEPPQAEGGDSGFPNRGVDIDFPWALRGRGRQGAVDDEGG